MLVQVYGWRKLHSGGISQRPNTSFYRVIGSTAIYSSFKNDTWCYLGGDVMLMTFFSTHPTLLFPPLENRVGHAKFQSYPLIYWDVKFIIHSFDFWFLFLVILWNFELFLVLSFNLNLWYIMFFQFSPHSFDSFIFWVLY